MPVASSGQRLDQALAEMFPDFSRSMLARWCRDGAITVDRIARPPKYRVQGGEAIVLDVELSEDTPVVAQPIDLPIVHEDEDLLVIDKPAGLVVHPAAGHASGTLQNALLHHDPGLGAIPRAGIVHRLDKLTSGVMVVARSLRAHHSLVDQLRDRSMGREYLALVRGEVIAGGTIEADIGRHPKDRKRMAVVAAGGKPAVTHYRVVARAAGMTLLKCRLETGRTHQIRVHLAHRGWPLIGDPVYGGRQWVPARSTADIQQAVAGFRRQALHARTLRLLHPATGEMACYAAPIADDLAALLHTTGLSEC